MGWKTNGTRQAKVISEWSETLNCPLLTILYNLVSQRSTEIISQQRLGHWYKRCKVLKASVHMIDFYERPMVLTGNFISTIPFSII